MRALGEPVAALAYKNTQSPFSGLPHIPQHTRKVMSTEAMDTAEKELKEQLDGAVVFDVAYFDELPEDAVTKADDFAAMLINKHVWSAPYDNIFLVGPQDAGTLHVRKMGKDEYWLRIYLTVKMPKSGIPYPLPVYHCEVDLRHGIGGHYATLMDQELFTKFFPYLKWEDAPLYTKNAALRMLAIIAMLRSKSVRVYPGERTDKLNKQRAKHGKPPAFPINVVKLVPLRLVQRGDAAGGHHASPVPHWRRGHVREYAPEKFTDVAPCMVNVADPDTLPIKPTYLVGSLQEKKTRP